MDTVTILRDLWRYRLAMVGVLLLSVFAGTLVLYKISPPLQLESRNYDVGVATTSVLIDTPSSQVAEIAPEGTDQLGVRADLLARIMVDGAVKAEIAKGAGVKPSSLVAMSTGLSGEPTSASPPRGRPALTTHVVLNNDGTQLPIIQIEAQSVDVAGAAKLADSAVAAVGRYVDKQAVDMQVPDKRRVRVTRLAATQAATAVRGPKTVFGLAAGIFVFGLGLGLILGLAALVRAWRTAMAKEKPWSETDVAWLQEKRARPEPIRPVAAGQPSPLRPADDARSATEPTQDDHPHMAGPQAESRDRRRRSAS